MPSGRQLLLKRSAAVRWAIGGLLAIAALGAMAPAAASGSAGERALELITPPDPIAATVRGTAAVTADGGRLAYLTLGPTPGALSGDIFAVSIATRSALGWTTAPIGLPYMAETFSERPVALEALSQDLLTTVWTSALPVLPESPPAGSTGLYRRGPDGGIELLANLGPSDDSPVGASASADRVVFATSAHLLPSDAGRGSGESIYASTGPQLSQVDVGDGGALLSPCGSTFSPESGVSRSGLRIYFTHPATSGCGTAGVYLREGGASTVEISASRCSRPDCNAPADVSFAGATPDGGTAFVTTTQQLTDEDHDSRADLYRYVRASDDLTLVSAGPDAAAGTVTPRPVLASEDGERVYFRAVGPLTLSTGGTSGENLYLADDSGLHFVAPVAEADTLQISDDGAIAILDTIGALLVEDADGRRDVYRYQAPTGVLAPLSFGPGFGTGPFDATILSSTKVNGEPRSRSLSADGATALFATKEPLSPADANESSDVYEWRGTTPELLGGGSAPGGTGMAGLSADGSTAIFITAATLLPVDRDGGELDLYAARTGGGLPEPVEPGCSASCERPAAAATGAGITPATLLPGHPKHRGRLRMRGDEGRLAREFARSGRAVLTVSAPAPGWVSARATERTGKRSRLVARGSAGAVRPGTVPVVLLATRSARARLARGDALAVQLEIRQAGRRLSRKLLLKGVGR